MMAVSFGFQNQPPLSRRRAPSTNACVKPPAKSTATGICRVAGVAADSGTMNDQTPHITIGERHGWGDTRPFGIATIDERQHIYIIGKTGSGKTTLLRNLIVQHIALGHGVGVIDPHGDLAEELLNHIPPKRADHLVYFNPGDVEFPVGLNVIGNVAPDDRHLAASGIVGAFKALWRDSWGPRLSEAQTLYSRWPELATEDKRKIAESIVEKIVIGEGEIDITLSYLPSSEQMTKSQQQLRGLG
jgi:hypothetical protein